MQIINIGLFAQDFQPLITSDITPEINIINTVDEFVAEIVLHHKDAVPENNKNPQKDIQAHKHVIFKQITIPKPQNNSAIQVAYHNKPTSLGATYNYLFCNTIHPPPPKL